MFENNINPVCFNFFGIEVYWYGVTYVFTIFFAIFYSKFISKKYFKDIDSKTFDDFINYACIGIIFGGRLGHVIFFEPNYYFNNLMKVFSIRDGGMSFHGGLIGIISASIIFSKIKKINFVKLLDIISLSAPFGLFFGRIANFINQELFGKITNVPWAVKFSSIDNFYRHPVQLYEAFFEGIILFIFINYVSYKKNFYKISGLNSTIFVIFYGVSRFLIDFLKDDYIVLNLLTVGQILSLIMISIGLANLLKIKINYSKRIFNKNNSNF